MKKILLAALLIFSCIFTSCKKEALSQPKQSVVTPTSNVHTYVLAISDESYAPHQIGGPINFHIINVDGTITYYTNIYTKTFTFNLNPNESIKVVIEVGSGNIIINPSATYQQGTFIEPGAYDVNGQYIPSSTGYSNTFTLNY